MFSVAKIKCVKKVETPFVPGGDAKFARKSQINFKLRNSSSACITFGDSLYIQWVIELRQSEPEYYFFSDDIVKTGEQSIYTYASAKDPENEKYICVVDFVVMDGKKYFLLMDTCAKDLEKVLHLVRDLKDLIR